MMREARNVRWTPHAYCRRRGLRVALGEASDAVRVCDAAGVNPVGHAVRVLVGLHAQVVIMRRAKGPETRRESVTG